jgi:transposase-like protein
MSGRVPPPSPPEVRLEAVHLVREGVASASVAATTVGCSVQTLGNWVLQAERDRRVPLSNMCPVPLAQAGFGVGTNLQVEPSHISANVTYSPVLFKKAPTAVQDTAEAHETP